ncbi:uncharacterized protein [Cherax quadricarinatus]|uniref:uncharacterized protein n=1 Tax=Cherax quadricarinatus TaxID=27406 RepID=UPI0023782724|nr:uncharacterized protein LOC128699461 [Cherax quadricarinatus]
MRKMAAIILPLILTSFMTSSLVLSQSQELEALPTRENHTEYILTAGQQGVTALHPLPAPAVADTEKDGLRPKCRPGGNLICYSCKLDFRKRHYEWDHPCLGRHNNHRVSDNYLVNCGPNDTICRVERTEVNGILIMLKRECTSLCYDSCRPKGFGINYELCETCCESDACNYNYPISQAPAPGPSSSCVAAIMTGWWAVVNTIIWT